MIFSDQLLELSSQSFQPQVFVGRDYCHYIGLSLEHVPKNKREQALRHQVGAQSRWDNTGYCVAWNSGFAQVWFWSADAVDEMLQKHRKGFAFSQIQTPSFFSETVLWKKPENSGVALLKCSSGFDLQNWQDGVLLASQWYVRQPSSQQVNRFFRSQGLVCLQTSLEVAAPVQLDAPWPGVVKPVWSHWFKRKKTIALALVVVFSLVASLQITSIVRWSIIDRDIQRQIVSLEDSANELLEARSQARRARLKITDIKNLFEMPDALSTQLKVYQRIPASLNLTLKKWERNFDQVEMIVEGKILDTLNLVQALDGDGFTEVSVARSRIKGQYKIKLKVVGSLRDIAEDKEK